VIGDVSNPKGGRLNRHRSHQTGRDADLGFYYRRGEVDTFLTARKKDLDLPRTWALVRALVTETDVDRIFVDRSLIAVLYAHAVAEGEDRDWLNDVFGRSGGKGIVQHERRHKDHLHIRFYNPRAQEHGRIVYPVLVEMGAAPPPMVKHRVRRGETLGCWRSGTGRASPPSVPRTGSGAPGSGRAQLHHPDPPRAARRGPRVRAARLLPPSRVSTASATASRRRAPSKGPLARPRSADTRLGGSMAFLARFAFALAVIFATYNPEGVSYYHWLRGGGALCRSRPSSASSCSSRGSSC